MTLESSRALARAGTLLIVLGTVAAFVVPLVSLLSIFSLASSSHYTYPFTSAYSAAFLLVPILIFAGYILFLVAMNGLANYYRDHSIFTNALYGFISAIVGGVVLVILFFAVFLTAFSGISTSTTSSNTPAFSVIAPIATPAPTISPAPTIPPNFSGAVLSILGLLAILWLGVFVIALVQSIFYKRAFDRLAEKSGEGNFKTAGLMMLIGGLLTIILIGGFVTFLAWIFATMGFFSLRAPPTEANILSLPQILATTTQKKNCPYCGAENSVDSDYCSHCGKKM